MIQYDDNDGRLSMILTAYQLHLAGICERTLRNQRFWTIARE